MPVNRYSSGHTVVQMGAYLLPVYPLVVLAFVHQDTGYVVTGPQFVALWALGLLVSYLLIGWHEFGHLAAAWACGIRVKHVTIGHGRKLLSFRLRGMDLAVRAAPDSGYVEFDLQPGLFRLPRLAAVFLAGVGFEAALASTVFSLSSAPPIESFATLAWAFTRLAVYCYAAYHIAVNLWPGHGNLGGTTHPTDGMQLLTAWKTRHDLPHQRELIARINAVNDLVAAGRHAEARTRLLELTAEQPDNIALLEYLAQILGHCGESAAAEKILRAVLARPSLTALQRAEVLDHLACLPLYHERRDLLAEAEGWIEEALRAAPHAITLQGTRGGLLVETNRIDEALPVLEAVMKSSECRLDHAITAAFLAKAHAAKGDGEAAGRWLATARRIDSTHAVVKRITAELSRDPLVRPG